MATSAFLGDELGPRGKRRVAVASVGSLVVIVGILAVAISRFSDKGQLDAALWRPLTKWSVLRFLLGGFVNTLKAAAVAIVFAIAVGVVMALGRLARNRPVRWLSGAGRIHLVPSAGCQSLEHATHFAGLCRYADFP